MESPPIESYEKVKSSLKGRAKRVLGLAKESNIDSKRLKKAFRRRAKENHPDLNPELEEATKYFQLILQAKNYLKEKKGNIRLLEDEKLIEDFIGGPVEELDRSYRKFMQAYEEWRRDQFYDMENESIWPK